MVLLAIYLLLCFVAICIVQLVKFIIRLPRIPLSTIVDGIYQRNRRHHLKEWTRRHGSFYCTLNFGSRRNFVISDLKILAEVFGHSKFESFAERKDPVPVPPHLRHVFTANGKYWRTLRRKVSIFSAQNLRSLYPLLIDSVQDMVEGMAAEAIKSASPLDFTIYSKCLVAAILARLAFLTVFPNANLEEEFKREFVQKAEKLIEQRDKLKAKEEEEWNWRKLIGMDKKSRKSIDVLRSIYNEMLALKKANEEGQEEKEIKSHERAGNEVATRLGRSLLQGEMKAVGIETVGFCLSCAMHFLSARPQLQSQLHADLQYSDDPPLLMAIIRETLRLCPIVAFANSRLCTSSTLLLSNGVEIQKGDTIEADIFSLGRNEDIWGADANEFHPERWLNGNQVGKDFDSAWLPFGMGPRGCLGIPLALAILKMALATIVGKLQLVGTEEDDEPNLVGKDVLWPKTVRMHVKCR